MKKTCLLLIMALVIMSSAAFAGTAVSYWVTAAGSTTPINEIIIGGIGSTVTLSVWYSTDVPFTTSVTTLFGWDTATTKGTAAVPLDGKLTGSLATNIQNEAQWGGPRTNQMMGGAGSGTRPYGLGTAFASATGVQQAPTPGFRLYDVTLTNAALGVGQQYVTKLWDAASVASLGGDCYLTGSQTAGGTPANYTPGNTAQWTWDVTVTTIPEPASMLALGTGLVGLVGFAVRRRRA